MYPLSEDLDPSRKKKCRDALRSRLGEQARYKGTFERNGTMRSCRGPLPTVLLKDITDASGDVVADHVWMNTTGELEAAELKPGDSIAFDAQVEEYVKGYLGHRDGVWAPTSIDYRLSLPTGILVVERADTAQSDIQVA